MGLTSLEHKPMYMADYVEQLDSILSSGNRKLLDGPGKVNHDQAIKKDTENIRKSHYLLSKKSILKASKEWKRK